MAKRKRKAAGTDGLPPKRRRVKKNTEPKYPKASFLGIPGELRNLIYRQVLVRPRTRYITPRHHDYPNLLKVSKQIYREAFDIFVEENEFAMEVIDNKPIVPLGDHHWAYRTDFTWTMSNRGRSWANLKEWIRDWHATGKVGLSFERIVEAESHTTSVKMTARAWNIAQKIRSLKWKAVEVVLEEFKMTAQDAGFVWT